ERPQDLVVYGGTGKAARNWDAYHVICRELRRLGNDETLLVQSGKAVGTFRTHEEAPRVLIANSNLVPAWASWENFRKLEAAGLTMYGQMTAGSWIYIGTQGILQGTYETFAAAARTHYGAGADLRGADPVEYVKRSRASMAVHCRAMISLGEQGAHVFDYGNNLRGQAELAGVANAFTYPGFVPAYIRPQFCTGRGPFRWAVLSGDPAD